MKRDNKREFKIKNARPKTKRTTMLWILCDKIFLYPNISGIYGYDVFSKNCMTWAFALPQAVFVLYDVCVVVAATMCTLQRQTWRNVCGWEKEKKSPVRALHKPNVWTIHCCCTHKPLTIFELEMMTHTHTQYTHRRRDGEKEKRGWVNGKAQIQLIVRHKYTGIRVFQHSFSSIRLLLLIVPKILAN